MSLPEITGRSRHEASKWLDRMVPGRWAVPSGASLLERRAPALAGGRTLEALRERFPARFFAGLETGAATRPLQGRLPSERSQIVARAHAICARRFDLLGYRALELGESIDWHLDAVSGVRAPRRHWTQLDPLNRAQVGDSKVTWELSRHQWLVTLAQAYWLTDDKRFSREAADLLHDWIDANPYGVGINWSSSLEVSYRLIAWCWAIGMLRESGACSDEECAGVLARIWLHACHIERYLSYYFSPNTHLTGEALGLFYAGALFQEFGEARRWRDLGWQILVDESRRQVLPDGIYFEQATCYQRYTIEIYLHFLLLAARNGIDVPVEVRQRVEQLLEALVTLTRPDGTLPGIGDADGGWLMPVTGRAPDDVRGVFGVAAAVFGRRDFAWAAGGLVPELIWLLGPAGVARFDALEPAPPTSAPSRLLAAGGYAVMRTDWSPRAHRLTLDVGPLGCPYGGAHGHADLLAVQIEAFGENHVVDPGTYCYTHDAAWRDHFRGSRAHSTVVIDGRSQAEPRGPFGWQHRPAARVRAWQSTPAFDFVDADHAGYADLPAPVTHRRRVLFVKPRYWVIVDDLSGAGAHHVELRFQFGPRTVQLGPDRWVSSVGRGGTGLWIGPFSQTALSAGVRQGQLDPIDGWVAPDYGQRQPAPVAVYAATTPLPLRVITLVVPAERVLAGPPPVAPIPGPDGRLTGLHLIEQDEMLVVDDLAIQARPGGR